MDESNSENDLPLSPSQILYRLQALRQLQLLQRKKLQKQRMQYQNSPESNTTELVSNFTDSPCYDSFSNFLQVALNENANNNDPDRIEKTDFIDGVSKLNISQESECITDLPTLNSSKDSENKVEKCNDKREIANVTSFDELPISSPRKDFETLIKEKLQNELTHSIEKHSKTASKKKTFLKKGEGISRFGVNCNNIVIQNTNSLPWRKKNLKKFDNVKDKNNSIPECSERNTSKNKETKNGEKLCLNSKSPKIVEENISKTLKENESDKIFRNKNILSIPKGKHPLIQNKGKTWAAVLTNEQNDFLQQLKQSDYYKNFASPTKSVSSSICCDDKLQFEKETAEQNMFELLESKVSNESFNINSSFICKFLRKSILEYSGESTPLVMQKCLKLNPELNKIQPNFYPNPQNETSDCCEDSCKCEISQSQHTEDDQLSQESCSSCSTCESSTCSIKSFKKYQDAGDKPKNFEKDTVTKVTRESDKCVNEIEDMNAKLLSTSDLLQKRLLELENEISVFKQENYSLKKLREELDLEKQNFYAEKVSIEQKFNEEKILSEYCLAEEKEKLLKQKQLYERYVREMRGRLNKKEKDETVQLKKDIGNLKEEMRLKDAKTTSMIARLRNQLRISEKEKNELSNKLEKLKKENIRLKHSNDVTRRLTNIKYLEEINKKLSDLCPKKTKSAVCIDEDIKYKSYEIERQARNYELQNFIKSKSKVLPRAKSVPNLNVTSRYAKYFSQRNAVSQMDKTQMSDSGSENYDDVQSSNHNIDASEQIFPDQDKSLDYDEEHFNSYLDKSESASPELGANFNPEPILSCKPDHSRHHENFFITKSKDFGPKTVAHDKKSDTSGSSKDPQLVSYNTLKSLPQFTDNIEETKVNAKRPVSILSNRSSCSNISRKSFVSEEISLSPEPSIKSDSINSSLNPIEKKNPDGSKEFRFSNGNVKHISADGNYVKFSYYNGDIKETFYNEGKIKYFYAESKTYHTTYPDGLEVLQFADGQVEKRYKDGSTEIRLPNGSVRYHDPKNEHVREEWRFPDGVTLTISANGEQKIVFTNGQIEVHTEEHKRREFPDGTVKYVYNDGTTETRYASGRVRIKDKHGNLIMDSAG